VPAHPRSVGEADQIGIPLVTIDGGDVTAYHSVVVYSRCEII
jgi:hypothetical protein